MARSDSRITKACRYCGNEFSIPQCRDWREHYCSPHCRAALKAQFKAELARICPVCSFAYQSRRNVEIATCSPQCAGVLARGRVQTAEAKAKRLASWEKNGNRARQSARKGPAHPRFMGRRVVGGYVWVWIEGRGYIAEHRYVAEQTLGRDLTDEEVVHHINEIKNDNRPENLTVMTRAEHIAEHRAEIGAARRSTPMQRGNKIDVQTAARILAAVKSGRTRTAVAKEFGLTQTMVSYIANGKSWKHAHRSEAEVSR